MSKSGLDKLGTLNGKYKNSEVKTPLIVSKKYGKDAEDIIQDWLATEAGFLEGFTTDVYSNPSKLYSYQIKYLNDRSFFIHIDKSRQTGYSYIYAGRSLARAHLTEFHTSIFISINQEEANEKIIYARGLYESLPLSVKKKIVVDNKHSLEFEDYSGKKRSRTRIVSHAQREPRGKGGNVDVYLDEAAHYTWGTQIYVAAVPIITRGEGSLTIGSTPLGKTGIHYDIMAKDLYKRIYSFHKIYWWNCIDFVKRGRFKEAQKKAPFMETPERVLKYGEDKLVGIFISMDIEQFQQEYELHHIDESVSFFPIELINKCVYEIVVDDIFLQEDEYSEGHLEYPIMERYLDLDFKLYNEIGDMQRAIQEKKVSGKLLGGYDVGRHHHTGEFSIVEELGEKHGYLQIVRHLKTFRNTKFEDQKAYLKLALNSFPNLKILIDKGSIGENLSEDLQDFSWRVDGIQFNNEWKEDACSNIRIRLENQTIALPDRKDVKNQIHSIKRKVTEHGKFVFDTDKNAKHHGDIFWSIAMASSLGEKPINMNFIIPGLSSFIQTSPRIIPINSARSFSIARKPKVRFMDASKLKKPEYVSRFHSKFGGVR